MRKFAVSVGSSIFIVEYSGSSSVGVAINNTIKNWRESKEGWDTLFQIIGHEINYRGAFEYVPAEIWEENGIKVIEKIDAVNTVVLDDGVRFGPA